MRKAVTALCATEKYTLNYANASRSGKYHSWSLTLEVESEAARNAMFAALKNHPQIKVVI
jgi:putative lipoic acid-binding regulatory protein